MEGNTHKPNAGHASRRSQFGDEVVLQEALLPTLRQISFSRLLRYLRCGKSWGGKNFIQAPHGCLSFIYLPTRNSFDD